MKLLEAQAHITGIFARQQVHYILQLGQRVDGEFI